MKKEERETKIGELCEILLFFKEYQFHIGLRDEEGLNRSRKSFGDPSNRKYPLSGYRMALRDTAVQVAYMPKSVQANFLVKFRERFGKDFFAVAGDPAKAAKKILSRGKIRNDGEFYLMKDYIDTIDEDEAGMALRMTIWQLLEQYEFGSKK